MIYYEHKDRVKIIDNILERSLDWQWFIDLTEKSFNPDINIKSFDEAVEVYNDVLPIFDFLCRIREITNKDFIITKHWLKELDILALFYSGNLNLKETTIKTEFAKVLLLIIYTGKIYSQTKDKKYYVFFDIFKFKNLFLLFNIDLFIKDRKIIRKLLKNININISKEILVFEDNINKKTFQAKDDFIKRHEEHFLSANAFTFNRVNDDNIRTWEEKEILDMLKLSYSNGKLTPEISIGNDHFPKYEVWTSDIIKHIKDYFNADATTFVVESIDYILHKTTPSKYTINKHFELLYDAALNSDSKNNRILSCSSLEFAISFLGNDSKDLIDVASYKKFNKVLKKLFEEKHYYKLFEIKERKALTDQKIARKLNEKVKEKLNLIENISSQQDFIKFVDDTRILSNVENSHVKRISSRFNKILENVQPLDYSTMFLSYFIFLIKIKNNKNVNLVEVKAEIIRIRKLWQGQFFEENRNALSTVSTGPIAVPKNIIDNYLNYVIEYPFVFARNCVKVDSENLVQIMSQISEHVFLLMAKRIIISEDFPREPVLKLDEKHPIDLFFVKEVQKQIKEKGYKFLNPHLDVKEWITGLYNNIVLSLQLTISMIENFEPLYEKIKTQNPNYKLIEYSTTPSLAHITQLFPILENKIRDFGELQNITPMCEDKDRYHRLKEPDSIFKIIINDVYKLGGDLSIVADLFFVHFCMYGENGLNIRNDIVHGNGYKSQSQLSFAFKVTMICLYMIGFRYQSTRDWIMELENKKI